jgi:chromosome segregation ATPase
MVLKKNEEKIATNFKSPARKLVTFFKGSRDKWKEKCQEAKYQIKLLKKRLAYTKKRKDEMKNKIETLEEKLHTAHIKQDQLEKEVERLKKNQY